MVLIKAHRAIAQSTTRMYLPVHDHVLRFRYPSAMNTQHILLVTIGSAGDVYPKVGLGRALRARGQRVTVITNPHFEDLIRANGLGFEPIGTKEDFYNTTQNPDLWHPTKGFKTIAEWGLIPFTQPVMDHIERYLPDNPIVVSSGMAFGARIAKERFDVPLVTVHLQPSVFRSVHDMPNLGGVRLPDWLPHRLKRRYYGLLDRQFIDKILAEPLNAIRAQYGLAPTRSFLGDYFHSPDKVIGLFPDWFAPQQPDWPEQTVLTGFVEFDTDNGDRLDPMLAQFLSSGTPPLVFTAGSANQHGEAYFQASAEAAQALGRRAILVTRNKSAIPAGLPESIIHQEFVPFSLLLPHTAAIVHHGGIGTLAKAVASGIPQIIMPLSHDQPDNARRVQQLGIGDVIQPKRYNARRAATVLDKLLNSTDVQRAVNRFAAKVDFAAAMEKSCREILTIAQGVTYVHSNN